MAATNLTSVFANRAATNHVPANFIRPRIPPVMAFTGAKPLLADLFQVPALDEIVNVAREFFHLPERESLKYYSDDSLKRTRLITGKASDWRDFLRFLGHLPEDFIQGWPTKPPPFRLIPFRFLRRGAMQRSPVDFCRKTSRPVYEVFINHRGIDTKWNFAGLLYDNLKRMRIETFLDRISMKPGDRLFDHIDKAILGCKVGVAVFSPRYCKSYSCLHELALLLESKKRLVPIFYDVKPSQLRVRDNGTWQAKELQRFSLALEDARNTVGLTFDSSTGDWSEMLRKASNAVIVNLAEAKQEQTRMRRQL